MAHPTNLRDEQDAALLDRLEQAEREVADLRHQLEHAHRLSMLGTLAAGVIHEINNILTPVLAYAQMVGSHPRDADLLEKFARKTVQGISQATAITESMLELAQPSRIDIQPPRALVYEACQGALNCLGRDPAKDHIAVTIDAPDDLACAIRPLVLQQVILNLLINAVEALKSVPRRDRELTIRARQDERGGRAIIEVTDNGPGIPEEIRPKLFAPFVSGRSSIDNAAASASSSKALVGSGLGLSVCRTLIEAAGGTINAESDSRTGTIFTIELPQDHAQSHKMAG